MGKSLHREEARGRDRPDRRRGGKEQRLKHHRRWAMHGEMQWLPRRPDSWRRRRRRRSRLHARCEDGSPRTRPAEVIAAMSGPSTNGEVNVRLPIPRRNTVDATRPCAVNSVQPSRSSRKKPGPRSARQGVDDPREEPAHAKNVKASTPSAAPGLPATTSTPRARNRGRRRRCARRPGGRSPAAAAPG